MHVRSLWSHAAAIVGGALALSGCSPKEHEAVVASVANEPITISEYEQQYLKNSPNRDSAAAMPMDARKHFLDLMVNYKLKLLDAKHRNLEAQPAVRNEIRQYKGGLASSYVLDREVVSPALHRLYDRRGEEIRASHILLSLSPQASPAESVEAYSKAREIMDQLKQGTPYDTLARRLSQDPSAAQNGGDLYYFSAGMMVPSFEDAVYGMQQGQTTIVRSQYGLHVVKLTDRRPSPGEIRASHIMIRFSSMNPAPEDTAAAFAKITAIKDSLAKGTDFAALAERNSGDPGSATQGGDLGWFGRRRWVLSFDEAAFRLKPGQVSGIVRTPYGYHLIKCTDQRPRKSYAEERQQLQQTYQQTRFPEDMAAYQARLRRDLGFMRNDGPIQDFLSRSDSTKTTRDSAWTRALTPTLGNAVVFTARGQTMTLDSMLSAINQRTDLPPTLLRLESFSAAVEKMEDQFVWTVAADSFARVYPAFASVLNEYRDGVLLYQMEQENVWNKVSPSDSVLKLFYARNKERFVWPERVEFTELRMPTERIAARMANMLKAGKSMEEIAVEDSIRMAQPAQFSAVFRQNSAALTSVMMKSLAAAAAQVKRDSTFHIQLTAEADTGNSAAAALATRRLDALKKYLTATLKVNPRLVASYRRPLAAASQEASQSAQTDRARQVAITISGRQPLVLSRPDTLVLAPAADPRAAHADSLTPGSFSAPFEQGGLYLIVRLNRRVPPQGKTFDEAQSEVSSLYQDTESKRLEDQWLKDLHSRYPVVTNSETLRDAFAPVKQ